MSDSYRDLIAWQKAMDLADEVHRVSDAFPKEETYGLTAHVRKSAVSVPSNIAEGKGRQTRPDYIQFLYRARGSLYETFTQLEIARRRRDCSKETFNAVMEIGGHAGRSLNGLISSLQESPKS